MEDSTMFQPFPFNITMHPTAEQIRALDNAQRAVEASQSMQFEIVHGIPGEPDSDDTDRPIGAGE